MQSHLPALKTQVAKELPRLSPVRARAQPTVHTAGSTTLQCLGGPPMERQPLCSQTINYNQLINEERKSWCVFSKCIINTWVKQFKVVTPLKWLPDIRQILLKGISMNTSNQWLHSPPKWNYTFLYLSSLYNFCLRKKWSFKRLQNVNLSVYVCAPMCTSLCVHAHLPAQCHFKLVVVVIQSCPTLWDPMTAAHQAPLSMGFSRQEYWTGLPFPSPENFLNPGIKRGSPALQTDYRGSYWEVLNNFIWSIKYWCSTNLINPYHLESWITHLD